MLTAWPKESLICEWTVTIPDEQASALNVPRERAAEELRMLAAVKLFELERLSAGASDESCRGDRGRPAGELTRELRTERNRHAKNV